MEGALRIANLLPGARFIFMKRNLRDLALRIFMKSYRSGNAYAYDLRTIREHVEWYDAMSDVLAEKLKDSALIVRYEDMVSEPEATLDAVCALCGLRRGEEPLPELGDDRGCAGPYRAQIDEAWRT